MTFNILSLLEQEGYIRNGKDNLIHAEKAFFAARIMLWIRNKVSTDPSFDLTKHLTMLLYYKTDLADLKFSEDEGKLLYKMNDSERGVQEIVDVYKDDSESVEEYEESGSATSTEDAGTDPDT